MRPLRRDEDLPRERILSPRGSGVLCRLRAGEACGAAAVLGVAILLLPEVSLEQRMARGARSARVRTPPPLAVSAFVVTDEAVDVAVRGGPGAVVEPHRTVRPRLRRRRAGRMDDVSGWWVRRYTERGDINREWVIDPVLLAWVGDVRGLQVLDAGCGGGYLSRILAKRGANVVGVNVLPKLIAEARASEMRDTLGIRFVRGNLAKLAGLRDESFDLVVSNVALLDVRRMPEAVREVWRVLRPAGRFVFGTTHPAFEVPPGQWVRVPPDTERPEEPEFFAVDRYLDRVAVYWVPRGEPEVVSFHRRLREFSKALYDAGFVVLRLEEPTPRPEALRRHYRQFADQLRVPNFLIVEARRP